MIYDKMSPQTLTCLRLTASCNKATTSSPSTPEHLNPLDHLTSRPTARPSCRQAKENVKPKGKDFFSR